jgi:hypothetical protein
MRFAEEGALKRLRAVRSVCCARSDLRESSSLSEPSASPVRDQPSRIVDEAARERALWEWFAAQPLGRVLSHRKRALKLKLVTLGQRLRAEERTTAREPSSASAAGGTGHRDALHAPAQFASYSLPYHEARRDVA